MKVVKTRLKDCFILEPTVLEDDRGYFYESYNTKNFKEQTGLNVDFVQDNQSKSYFGVLRGLHFQKGVHAQAKLMRVLSGEILDVAVDLRPSSSTYGQYESVMLSEKNKKQLFVPRGFAHGFSVLSGSAEILYKCDNYYNPASESGIIYNDSTLNIDWKVLADKLLISKKDLDLQSFDSQLHYF